MCKWGTTTNLTVTIPAHLSHTGAERQDVKDIDSCIVDIVRALNDAGIITVASCCGHGKRPGNIALLDGREIIIAPDYETGRLIDSIFPPVNEPPKIDPVTATTVAPVQSRELCEYTDHDPQACLNGEE